MKVSWRRTSKDAWKSRTVAKRRYEIGRWERRGPGGRRTGIVGYHVACFAVGRTSGKWYVRYLGYGIDLRSLKDAKGLAQRHANGEYVEPTLDERIAERWPHPPHIAQPTYYVALANSERDTLH